MKTFFLALSFSILSLTSYNYSNFNGSWESNQDPYTVVINFNNKKDYYLYTYNKNVEGFIHFDLHEKNINFKNNKISVVFYKKNSKLKFKVTYELLNKNTIKAIFKGDKNKIIYYNKI